jgi:salicylate synthetase
LLILLTTKYQNRVDALIQGIKSGELHKAIISRFVKVKGDMDILGTYALELRVIIQRAHIVCT